VLFLLHVPSSVLRVAVLRSRLFLDYTSLYARASPPPLSIIL
jgi:hypothetical protein